MSTELDLELVPETLALINEFGKQVVLSFDEDTFSDIGAPTPTNYQQTLRVTPPDPTILQFVPNSTVVGASTGVFVPASGLIVPVKNGLKVTIDGVIWTTVAFSPIYTGDDIAMYGLGLKQ